jgi:hypothetical protein
MVSNRHNNDWVSRSLTKITTQKEGLRIENFKARPKKIKIRIPNNRMGRK